MINQNDKENLYKSNIDFLLNEDTKALKDTVMEELCNTLWDAQSEDTWNVPFKLRTIASNSADKKLIDLLNVLARTLYRHYANTLKLIDKVAKDSTVNVAELIKADIEQKIDETVKQQMGTLTQHK